MVGLRITLHNGNNTDAKGYLSGEASVRPRVVAFFVMRRVVGLDALEFIIPSGTKNWILLGDSLQYYIAFLSIHKTGMPFFNVAKDV